MSGSAAGDHLEREQLNGTTIPEELHKFSEWLSKDGRVFSDINPSCSKCTDEGKNKAIRPLLKELGFDDEVDDTYPTMFKPIKLIKHRIQSYASTSFA